MSSNGVMPFNIAVESGTSVTLPTEGKYCDRNIIVSAIATDNNKLVPYLNRTLEKLTEADLEGLTTVPGSAFMEHSNIKRIALPNTVTSIGTNAFYKSGLNYLKLSSSLKSLPNYMCYSCTQLVCPEIPNSVETIGQGTFQNCNGLGTIIIPDSVMTIGSGAFYNTATWSPDTIVMMGSMPPSIQSDTFNIDAVKEVVLLPGNMDTYASATNWSALASKMVERAV